MSLIDSFGRKVDYLRISLTPFCNFKCFYCKPNGNCLPEDYPPLLNMEELKRIIEVTSELGIRKIRLTGGEPLLRDDLPEIISCIADASVITDISLTTNAFALKSKAIALKEAGLKRVNVSLDSLVPQRFLEMTGGGELAKVMEGVEKALEIGLEPLKLNVVAIKGLNDSEIHDFARLTIDKPVQVRFIEYMPIGGKKDKWSCQYISIKDIKEKCDEIGELTEVEKATGAGPAKYYKYNNSKGMVGFISPISNHFCHSCNRLRITSDGKLKPCLFTRKEIDIREAIKNKEDLKQLFIKAVNLKPSPEDAPTKGEDFKGNTDGVRGMVEIGG